MGKSALVQSFSSDGTHYSKNYNMVSLYNLLYAVYKTTCLWKTITDKNFDHSISYPSHCRPQEWIYQLNLCSFLAPKTLW